MTCLDLLLKCLDNKIRSKLLDTPDSDNDISCKFVDHNFFKLNSTFGITIFDFCVFEHNVFLLNY